MLDLLIQNISIADGSGGPLFTGCVGVKNGKIMQISEHIAQEAKETVTGSPAQILAPGFLDTHTHGDLQRLLDPYLTTQLLQGVTYDLCGNCGISAAPVTAERFPLLQQYVAPVMPIRSLDAEWSRWDIFGKYLDAVAARQPKIGTGALVGHGTLRIAVMGMENRAPTAAEMKAMKALLCDAMEAGALGLSSGLIYTPGVYSKQEELTELCQVVAKYGGVYSTHLRNESARVLESVEEAISVAATAGCKLLLSHHKVSGPRNRALAKKTLARILQAREEGLEVICDQYQSNKGSTTMAALLPPFCQSGGTAQLLEQLRAPQSRAAIVDAMKHDGSYENFLQELGPANILIVSAEHTPQYNALSVAEVAADMGVEGEEAVCRLIDANEGVVLMAVCMCEQEVVDEIFRFPYTAIGSDGIGAGTGARTHPRATGNQVHMLEDYVRNRHLVSWEEAIRKCTSLPADFLGLRTKGHIAPGYDADLVIFDRDLVGTDASFAQPNAAPRGIDFVFVSGKLLVRNSNLVK